MDLESWEHRLGRTQCRQKSWLRNLGLVVRPHNFTHLRLAATVRTLTDTAKSSMMICSSRNRSFFLSCLRPRGGYLHLKDLLQRRRTGITAEDRVKLCFLTPTQRLAFQRQMLAMVGGMKSTLMPRSHFLISTTNTSTSDSEGTTYLLAGKTPTTICDTMTKRMKCNHRHHRRRCTVTVRLSSRSIHPVTRQ